MKAGARLQTTWVVVWTGWLCAGPIPGSAVANTNDVTPVLVRAHSHNDYTRTRPLFDALAAGFNSVEADVFLVGDRLLVGHHRWLLNDRLTLQGLYLDPLRACARTNAGKIHSGVPTFWLLIEIKSEPEPTYRVLRGLLESYSEILTRFEGGQMHTNAVTVVITGRRPVATLAAEPVRFAALDSFFSELERAAPPNLYLWVSEDWRRHFTWRGVGVFPEAERIKLSTMVERAHLAGRMVRFWNAPDMEPVWEAQYEAGVDLLNTDDLRGLGRFLRKRATGMGEGK